MNPGCPRVKTKFLATPVITSSRSFSEIKMDDYMPRQFDYGGEVGWERPSSRSMETRAAQVSQIFEAKKM
jgi:hypothetical protein